MQPLPTDDGERKRTQNNPPLFPVRPCASDDLNSGGDVTDKISNNLQRTAAPSILLAATLRWPIAARLAIVFANMGCRVAAICPGQHPATKTRAVAQIYPYAGLMPLVSLRAAIKSAAPDLIIPCDDNAAIHLHQLYECAERAGASADALRALVARSLGTPGACALATERGRLMSLAAGEGVRVPKTTVVAAPGELDARLTQHGFPAVIKLDGTWGGQGVSIVRSHEEAQHFFGLMMAHPAIANAMARMILDRDPSFFLNALKKAPRTVTLQDFIPGAPANRAVACWQGQVLAGISVEAITTQHPTGPATVVRVIENAEMSEAANRLVRRLGISGLWGLDFILEASSGAAYLIEMNPRATPICHLPLGARQNLPAALYTQLTGTPPPVPSATIDCDVIAMFPGEWQRNPASSYLRSAYHDIPWVEPGLVQDFVDRPWSERGLIARLWARMRPKSSTLPTQHEGPVDVQTGVDYAHDHVTLEKFNYLASSTLDDTTFVR